jgi:hypothetical protein
MKQLIHALLAAVAIAATGTASADTAYPLAKAADEVHGEYGQRKENRGRESRHPGLYSP